MLLAAIVLFAIAAILGLYLLSFVIKNKMTPRKIVFIHGPVAAAGLIVLIIYAFYYQPAPIIPIIIFILAALGGLTLFYKDMSGKPFSKWLAIGHGTTAIVGFLFLIYFAFFS